MAELRPLFPGGGRRRSKARLSFPKRADRRARGNQIQPHVKHGPGPELGSDWGISTKHQARKKTGYGLWALGFNGQWAITGFNGVHDTGYNGLQFATYCNEIATT
jgi:hypothetical protein